MDSSIFRHEFFHLLYIEWKKILSHPHSLKDDGMVEAIILMHQAVAETCGWGYFFSENCC